MFPEMPLKRKPKKIQVEIFMPGIERCQRISAEIHKKDKRDQELRSGGTALGG